MADKLHYNKNDLLKEYSDTFKAFMITAAIGVGGAVLYFFFVIIYLGGWGHTHGADYVRTFSDRVQYEYSGTKLPEYEDPSLVSKTEPTKEAH